MASTFTALALTAFSTASQCRPVCPHRGRDPVQVGEVADGVGRISSVRRCVHKGRVRAHHRSVLQRVHRPRRLYRAVLRGRGRSFEVEQEQCRGSSPGPPPIKPSTFASPPAPHTGPASIVCARVSFRGTGAGRSISASASTARDSANVRVCLSSSRSPPHPHDFAHVERLQCLDRQPSSRAMRAKVILTRCPHAALWRHAFEQQRLHVDDGMVRLALAPR